VQYLRERFRDAGKHGVQIHRLKLPHDPLKVAFRTNGIGKGDAFWFPGKHRMTHGRVSDVSGGRYEIFKAGLQRRIGQSFISVLPQERRKQIPFLFSAKGFGCSPFNDCLSHVATSDSSRPR
jgi:hypothetical protein